MLLNDFHGSQGVALCALALGCVRRAALLAFCIFQPYALTAIAVNFLGACVAAAVAGGRCKRYMSSTEAPSPESASQLRSFVVPLIPGVIYFLFQGHISTLLLALSGATSSIAEVGALGRLGQLLSLLALLNGHFIQPYFARIASMRLFAKRAIQTLTAVVAILIVVTLSVHYFPEPWLAILGPNYKGLTRELPIAMIGMQLSVLGGIVYTIVIATKNTRRQWWQIVFGMGGQLIFIYSIGVQTTVDALLLNLIPAAAYFLLQCGLLVGILVHWKKYDRA